MRWIKDHVVLIVLVLIAIFSFVAAIAFRRKDAGSFSQLIDTIEKEKEVIDAKAAAAKMAAEKGHAEAAERIKQEYAGRLAELDAAAKKRADELANDPEALVELLLRNTR